MYHFFRTISKKKRKKAKLTNDKSRSDDQNIPGADDLLTPLGENLDEKNRLRCCLCTR